MIRSLILVLSLLGLSAQASFIQKECSSASGDLIMNFGHAGNKFTVNVDPLNSNPQVLDLAKMQVSVLATEITTLSDTTTGPLCTPDSETSFVSWNKVVTQRLTITKKDSSEFPEGTKHLSADGKSISTYVICEENGNSMTMCN